MLSAYIVPHPPLALSEIGRGEEKKISSTVNGFRTVARKIAEDKPQTIVIISPHSVFMEDAFYIAGGMGGRGSMAKFGSTSPWVYYEYDTELAMELVNICREQEIPNVYTREMAGTLDHGAVVPFTFINEAIPPKNTIAAYRILRVSPAFLGDDMLVKMGRAIERAAANIGRKIVVIASGDLSHKLTVDGPYGYDKEGAIFDKEVTYVMKSGDLKGFCHIRKELAEAAAQCGLNGFIMLYGALKDYKVKPDFISYEGPFGVGYSVCAFSIEDLYVRTARKSLESYVKDGKLLAVDLAEYPHRMLSHKAGAFVSIKKNGILRGCIGTIMPTEANVVEEIIHNAISAGIYDDRFKPVIEDELPLLSYSVDVMSEPEIASREELNADRYGVIVESGNKKGLLLPGLNGIDSVDTQIVIALKKAGISPNESYRISRFTVERHT